MLFKKIQENREYLKNNEIKENENDNGFLHQDFLDLQTDKNFGRAIPIPESIVKERTAAKFLKTL